PRNQGFGAGTAPTTRHSLTRHTSRGVPFDNAQVVELPDDISLPNPFIAWDQNLSEAGARLVQLAGIEEAVQDALNQIDAGKWRGVWTELRADFLYQRTFTTAKILHDQLRDSGRQVPVTAVLDESNPNSEYHYANTDYDALTYAMLPGSFPDAASAGESTIDPDVLQEKSRVFLNWLNLALKGHPFKGTLPPVIVDGAFNSFYSVDITNAVDLVIMSAYPRPPLNTLFGNRRRYRHQRELLVSACELFDYTIPRLFSDEFAACNALPIATYFDLLQSDRTGTMLVTHDIRQLQFLNMMDIGAYGRDIPFQSYIIVRGGENICIMYTAPRIGRDGAFDRDSTFRQKIWEGTVGEWDQKVAAVEALVPSGNVYPIKAAVPLRLTSSRR
ncbi:MAG: hypothetical protein ACKOCK_06625, partial [Chloroflexota bacterium]